MNLCEGHSSKDEVVYKYMIFKVQMISSHAIGLYTIVVLD